jgi:hypothetical protein
MAGIACRAGRWSHTTVRSVLLRLTERVAGAGLSPRVRP